MTGVRKKGDEHDLGRILANALYEAECEKMSAEILAAPNICAYTKRLVQAGMNRPVLFEDAVELITEATLMKFLVSVGRQLMTPGGENLLAFADASIEEIFSLFNPNTREEADFMRLINLSKTDPFAFDTCLHLWRIDQCKDGMPNRQLRFWRTTEPTRPPATSRIQRKLLWRDLALMWLISDAHFLGFSPFKNEATGSSGQSACDVVVEALRRVKLPAPTAVALEAIWKKNRHIIPWRSSERCG